MSKKFDCVNMKHKAAKKIRKQLAGLSLNEELIFWQQKTDALRKQKDELIRKQKMAS